MGGQEGGEDKAFTGYRGVKMHPQKPRMITCVGENLQELSWNGEKISLHLMLATSSCCAFSLPPPLAAPFPFPLQHHQP